MSSEMTKYYVVYNAKLAGHLMMEDFQLMKIRTHKFKVTQIVYLFKPSTELFEAIEKYKNNRQTA